MKKYLLEITVFFTGAGVMVFELVASRVLAPYVGTTITVWSCLIGIILAALSFGYWWGGRLADRKADYYHFALLIFFAAVLVALSGFFKYPLLAFLDKHINSLTWEAFTGSLILFAPGSFFMAAVSPYAVRLRLANVKETGSIVGNLYAVSTAGSIAGAFLTGLVLVTYIGNTKIIYSLAVVLLFASFLAYRGRWFKARIAATIISIMILIFGNQLDGLFQQKNVIYVRSPYLDITIGHATDIYSNINTASGTGRPILTLSTGATTTQSAMFTDNPTQLVLPYSEFFLALSKFFDPDGFDTALMIGGAAYSYPKAFLQAYPNSTMDVVEIDPTMTAVAKKYFDVPDDPRLTTYNEDGRVFLNHNTQQYSVIYLDAFRTFTPPYQLTTLQTAQRVYDSLDDDGMVFMNMIASIQGDDGKFFRSQYEIYKKVFPEVYVFRVQYPLPNVPQNLVIVATKSHQQLPLSSTDPAIEQYLQHVYTDPIPADMPIMTDDFAPTEHYMLAADKDSK